MHRRSKLNDLKFIAALSIIVYIDCKTKTAWYINKFSNRITCFVFEIEQLNSAK